MLRLKNSQDWYKTIKTPGAQASHMTRLFAILLYSGVMRTTFFPQNFIFSGSFKGNPAVPGAWEPSRSAPIKAHR